MNEKPIIAILLGDTAGVGPELVAKLTASGFFWEHCRPLLLGDVKALEMGFRQCGCKAQYKRVEHISEADWPSGVAPVLDTADMCEETVEVGRASPDCGAACVSAVKRAAGMYQNGEINGVCYAPFNKAAMIAGGNPAKSEMELFAMCLGHSGAFGEINVLDSVWTTRVTGHIPLAKVSESLSIGKIVESVALAHKTLLLSGIHNPRIALAALNPHCGESGMCGTEEIDMIAPATGESRKRGINASGPYPSDTVFSRAFDGEFDAVVTMYHDQGQIALKSRGFDRGITIGGGFDMPVTTCAHGTAFEIAGKGIASSTSLENAVIMVSKMAAKGLAL